MNIGVKSQLRKACQIKYSTLFSFPQKRSKQAIHSFIPKMWEMSHMPPSPVDSKGVVCSVAKTSLSLLQLIPNSAARILTRARKCENKTQILLYRNWGSFKKKKKIVNLKIVFITFKDLRGLAEIWPLMSIPLHTHFLELLLCFPLCFVSCSGFLVPLLCALNVFRFIGKH